MIRVTVPGSTSNLGSGFDCVGLALDRYLVATFEPGDTMSVDHLGTLAGVEGDDLVATILADHDVRGTLTLDSTIPVGRGLGSSAAATIAALAIIAAVEGESFDYGEFLREATDLEGHPDNAAPAILGGLVAVVSDGERMHALQMHLSEAIGWVYAAPHALVSTKAARQALPAHVPHLVATRSVARSVALMEGLAEADPELLRIGFGDELHVPYRIGMIPGGAHAIEAALGAGAWAATISGSGSGLIAACERGSEPRVLAAMSHAFEAATAQEVTGFVAQPDFAGVQIERVS